MLREANLFIIMIDDRGYDIYQSDKDMSSSEVEREWLRQHPDFANDIDGDSIVAKRIDADRLARLLF